MSEVLQHAMRRREEDRERDGTYQGAAARSECSPVRIRMRESSKILAEADLVIGNDIFPCIQRMVATPVLVNIVLD